EKQSKSREVVKVTKGFTARQWGIFLYYASEAEGVYYDTISKNTNVKEAVGALVKMTGYGVKSFEGKIIPDLSNEQDRKDAMFVANTIKPVLPKTYESMMIYLGQYE
ncbi:MAG: hypothetical protein Q4D33_04300, partial [Prevotellaceae bacterium]|nr:hypothetical protein [Prevotellaceae bacterium]